MKLLLILFIVSCSKVDEVVLHYQMQRDYRMASLKLAKENRMLKAKISDLEYQVSDLETEKNFVTLKLDQTRKIASVTYTPVDPKNDLVNYATYKWDYNTLISLADKEFQSKNYIKSAQLYKTAKIQFPTSILDEHSMFKAGLSSFESNYNDWAKEFFSDLNLNYQRSKYSRPSKLWTAIVFYRQGKKDEFVKILKEFELNYKNSEEWKILVKYHEKINAA